ncbi:hypothetical protein F8G81_08195 [Arthrobacter sp. CDRTa11]|uniref:hypothetical protein n=1 Tax=Arthrobacter sp. CDRTa11 TaxID=2651199 RepID=UPI0022659021|nr:hypothetical protein [Arthrobacter sp. CDRTa11]UZX02597.1 hypothetical protein F8G81_08195 [Arthrobacter sp. CDRTa11]
MRENNPPQEEEEPASGLGPMAFGILFGTAALYALYILGPGDFALLQAGADSGSSSIRFLTGPSAFVPIAGYLAIGILLAVWPPTSRWGAGLLIGLGIFTLLGGGVCVGALAQMGG